MEYIIHLISMLTNSIFIQNILLANFLGMCSFLAISKRIDTSIGLGIAVIFVLVITEPINWFLDNYLLKEGALKWINMQHIDLSFLKFISFISVIAAIVQLVEMIIEKISQSLYSSLGIFLPLIAVNCAILGVALFASERNYDFYEANIFALGSGIGWALAIIGMACIREKTATSNIPENLKGLGITMITTGLMAIGFMCFTGINLESNKDEKKKENNIIRIINKGDNTYVIRNFYI